MVMVLVEKGSPYLRFGMAGVQRVCLAGDAATGKTSLANSLVCGQFSEVPSADTIFSKSLNVDGRMTVVEFVDTSGSGDEYERSRVQMYPSSDLFLILFSIISPTSYESVRSRVCTRTTDLKNYQIYFLVDFASLPA
jgi:GTPase SAR1 family protein